MVEDEDLPAKIRNILKFSPRGLTISEISQRLRCNRNSVSKYLDILQIAGTVEMQQMGAAKVYYPSQRIPLSNLIGFTKEGIIVISTDGKILEINERFCRMFDLDQMTFAGKLFESLPDPIKKAFLFKNYLNLHSESEHTVIIPYNTYDWRRFFKVKYIRTVFEDGKTGLTIFVEDVTLEKEMEEQLKLNEARFRGIVEDQTELICRFTRDGLITFANEAFCRFFKRINSLTPDCNFFDIFPEDMVQYLQRQMSTCSANDPVFQMESTNLLPDSEFRWFHWITRALVNDNGEIIEYQSVGRDITDRKNDEREILIKSHAIDSSILPTLLTDLNGRIKYVNTAFLNLWGYYLADDVIEHSIEDFVTVSMNSLLESMNNGNSHPHGGFSGEVSGTKCDGSKIYLSLTISTVYEAEKSPICLIAYFYDISERVRMIHELEIKNIAIAKSYEGMAILSPEGVLKYVNPSFVKIFKRVPYGTMVDRDIRWFTHFYPQIFSILPEIKLSLENKGVFTQIFSDTEEDGSRWIIQMHLSRAYDNQDKHLCTLISALDITDQKVIEESLAITVNQLEGTVEQIGDPTFIISRDRMIVAWNNAMESFSGIGKNAMIGTSRYKEIISGRMPSLPLLVDLFYLSSKELIQSFPNVSKMGNSLYTEAYVSKLHNENGTYVWVRASPIVDASGKSIGIIQTMKDMTNWKRVAESVNDGYIRPNNQPAFHVE